MSNNIGWISLQREIRNHWLWTKGKKPKSSFEAWIDLLMMVNRKEEKVSLGMKLISVKIGQRITSIKQLSERWKWSRSKVKRFLLCLQSDSMLTFKTDTQKTVITITNYYKYQIERKQNEHQTNNERTTNEHQTNINNKENNDDNDNKKQKPSSKKTNFLPYLQEKINSYGYTDIQDKIIEFFNYRQEFPKAKRYKSEKGINGLFRHISGCRDSGLNVFECLEITMEEGWQTPNPEYFKNKQVKNNDSGFSQIQDACQDFVKNHKVRGENNELN